MPDESNHVLARRDFLKKVAVGGAGLGLATATGVTSARAAGASGAEEWSFVHLTDMHVRRKRMGHVGYARCIEHVNSLEQQPALVLMGGDGPFDGLYTEKDEFTDQVTLYKEISDRLNCPYYHCMGNHDVLGYSARRKVPIDDPDIGKKLIMDRLGMDRSYYSFDVNGWHFVVLDSIYPVDADHGPSYVPRLGEEQLEWLRADLGANHGKPTVAVIHIAAFCNIGQIEGDTTMPAMHTRVIQDGRQLRLILERHGVKAVLQGHMHMIEDYFYNGVWYITSQSVSAAWWGGNWRGFRPGYTVFSVRGDELSWARREYEWEHHLEPEDDLERQRIREHQAFRLHQQELLEEDLQLRGLR
jgi:3',5'-cyclic-AMP phosphodiesterase